MSEELEWLVYSREHNAFWRPNSAGYTWDINAAGRYTKAEADKHCDTWDEQQDGSPSEVAVVAPEAAAELKAQRETIARLEKENREQFIALERMNDSNPMAVVQLVQRVEALEKEKEAWSTLAGQGLQDEHKVRGELLLMEQRAEQAEAARDKALADNKRLRDLVTAGWSEGYRIGLVSGKDSNVLTAHRHMLWMGSKTKAALGEQE